MGAVGDFFDDVQESGWWDQAGQILTNGGKVLNAAVPVSTSISQMLGGSGVPKSNTDSTPPQSKELKLTPFTPGGWVAEYKWVLLILGLGVIVYMWKRG